MRRVLLQPGEHGLDRRRVTPRAQCLNACDLLLLQRRVDPQDLERLRAAARATGNLMPPILDAVRTYATVGEMCDALRDVWGEYEEVPVI